MDDDDDFFEIYKNKDLSKVKKFSFKKKQETKLPEKPFSSVKSNEGRLNSTSTSTVFTSKDSAVDKLLCSSRQLVALKKKEETTIYPFLCCDTKTNSNKTLNGSQTQQYSNNKSHAHSNVIQDDFLEQFRNKDLSTVKKFNFKKTKESKSPEKSFSSLKSTEDRSTSALYSSKEYPFLCCEDKNSLQTQNGSNLGKKNNFKQEVEFPVQKLTIPSNNSSKSIDLAKDSAQSSSIKNNTFRSKEEISLNTFLTSNPTSSPFNDDKADNILDSLYKNTDTSPLKSNNSKTESPVPKTLNDPLQKPSKKFTFKKKDEIKTNKLLSSKFTSPIKGESFLDNLYKNTGSMDKSPSKETSTSSKSTSTSISKANEPQDEPKKFSLSLKKSVAPEGSPSLLSGRPKLTSKGTLNISKYFNTEDKPEAKIMSPFKKILQSKKVESTSTNKVMPKEPVKSTFANDEPISISDSSFDTESPVVVKPKKFVFKKKPLTALMGSSVDKGENTLMDLEKILGNNTSDIKELPSSKDDKFNNSITNKFLEPYEGRHDLEFNSIKDRHTDVISTTTKNVKEDDFFNAIEAEIHTTSVPSKTVTDILSANQSVSSTQALEITDNDYMDDEEFERRFGSLADQFDDSIPNCSMDNPSKSIAHKEESNSPKKLEKESSDHHSTDELLHEISNMNWDENVFEDEPVEQGFKDRDDDSAEFRRQYEHSEVMMEVLHQKFGLRNFRPHQREIINASLTQHDCFVLMPTGGGKSLCYQLPAILMPGVTIVISPLRALISDQVDKLKTLDIAAAHLCSDVSKTDSEEIYMKLSMREPGLKLLYLTPEKIVASRAIIDILNSLYQRGKLARFVIDEVHCLSQWGHDFRPDYKQLGMLRRNYSDVPIICLTATATKQVENDVINILKLKNVKKFIRSFNRPNIKYEVVEKKGKAAEAIVHLIKTKFNKQSGIVYCLSRKDCDNLANDLNRLGVKSKPYHAGMSDKVREAIQREWMQDRFHVIVATIAFGMGIDKPDVRFVIHNSIPKSVEAFYQESGRAGRDGEVSHSYLFYNYGDVGRLQRLIQLDRNMTKKTLDAHFENLKQMVSFAENLVDCRRYLQLIHLGEHFDRRICIANAATVCDNCENIEKYKPQEVTQEAKELCTIVKDLCQSENVTMLHVADVYRGAKVKKILDRRHNQHRFYGAGASMDRNNVHRVLKELILKRVLQDHCTYTGEFPVVYIKPGPKFYQFYNSDNYQLSISVSTETTGSRQRKIDHPENTSSSSSKTSTSGWIGGAGGSSSRRPTASKDVVPHTVQRQNTAKLQAARKLQLTQLKVQCHEELLEECRRLAMERNLTLSSVMNLSAIKTMSDLLPSTMQEMLKIQHVTAANYNKYGEFFLKVTQNFRQKHDAIQPLTQLPRGGAADLGGDNIHNFAEEDEEEAFRPISSQRGGSFSSPRSGGKRKSGWGGKRGGFKKRKVAYRKKKKASPGKGKAAAPTSSGWKSKGGGRGGRGGGGGGLGLMPLHIM